MQANTGSPVARVLANGWLSRMWQCKSLEVEHSIGCRAGSSYGSTTGHGPQKRAVDFDDFLNSLWCNPVSCCSSWICGYNDTSLKSESQGSRAMSKLDRTVWVGMIICCCAEKCWRLRWQGQQRNREWTGMIVAYSRYWR